MMSWVVLHVMHTVNVMHPVNVEVKASPCSRLVKMDGCEWLRGSSWSHWNCRPPEKGFRSLHLNEPEARVCAVASVAEWRRCSCTFQLHELVCAIADIKDQTEKWMLECLRSSTLRMLFLTCSFKTLRWQLTSQTTLLLQHQIKLQTPKFRSLVVTTAII